MAYLGDGIQSIAGIVVWPLFIWLLLEESFQAVGLISALIIFVTLIVRLILGDYIDKHSKQKLLNLGSVLYSAGWVIKIFVASAFHVFLASVYHNISAIVMRAPFDASMYDTAADWGHYADEFTVIRELALTFGRILGLFMVLVLLSFLPLNITFVIAAAGSLLLASFTHDREGHDEHSQITNM